MPTEAWPRIKLWLAKQRRRLNRRIWLMRLRSFDRLTTRQLKQAWKLQRLLSRKHLPEREAQRLPLTIWQSRWVESETKLPLPLCLTEKEIRTWEEAQLIIRDMITLLRANKY